MPKITILPLERVIEADDASTIMEAAHEDGLYWPTTCGGEGICTSCACTIEKGEANLEPMGRGELKTLAEELSETAVRARRLRRLRDCLPGERHLLRGRYPGAVEELRGHQRRLVQDPRSRQRLPRPHRTPLTSFLLSISPGSRYAPS